MTALPESCRRCRTTGIGVRMMILAAVDTCN